MQNKNLEKNFIGIMPMAGEGLRFKKHGYVLPKPLIKINNTPMFLKAAKSFPKNLGWVFVTNKSIATNYNIIENVHQYWLLLLVDSMVKLKKN